MFQSTFISYITKRLKKQRSRNTPDQTLNTVIIHSENILHNLRILRDLHPHDAYFPVVKSNAYGHGCREIVSILAKTNCEMISVDSYPEYQIVRDYSNKPILIMGELTRSQIRNCDFQRSRFVINSLISLKQFAQQKNSVSVHLFVNTGMNREGLSIGELSEAIDILHAHPHLIIEGLMSHLSDGDDVNPESIQVQQNIFKEAFEILCLKGIVPIYRHLGASAGTLAMDDFLCNAWRPGLALYGYNPLPKDHPHVSRGSKLKPALSIQSTITCTQLVEYGQGVSYTKSRRAYDKHLVGIVAFGYAEGLIRSLSNKILLGPYQQIGNICMNYSTILLGGEKDKKSEHTHIMIVDALAQPETLEQRAEKTHTIVYEVLVKLSPSLQRKII